MYKKRGGRCGLEVLQNMDENNKQQQSVVVMSITTWCWKEHVLRFGSHCSFALRKDELCQDPKSLLFLEIVDESCERGRLYKA